MIVAFIVLLPFALLSRPSHAPGWKSLLSAVALGVLGTAIAQVLSYRMIGIWGSSRSVLVAYMLPAFALFYGALILSEPVTWQKLCGLVLILVGVGLGSGAVRLVRRTPVTQTP
jgi:drug/metabolite transporter (DMT)-like permease